MPSWKKVVTSGSNAILQSITSSGAIKAEGSITASSDISSSGNFTTPYIKIQPGSATSNQKLLEGYVGATQKFSFDEDGDLQLDGNINLGGNIYLTDSIIQIDSDDNSDTGPFIDIAKQGTSAGITQTFISVQNDSTYVLQLEGEDSADTMVLQLYGYTGINAAKYISTTGASSYVDINGTTDATSANGANGALRCEGGASIEKKLYVGSDIITTGTSKVISGSATSTGSFGHLMVGGGNFTSASLAAGGGGGGGSFNNFTLTADGGSNQTIADGNTLDIAGGTNITTAVGATDTVTVNLDASPSITNLSATGTVSASGDLNLGYKPDAGSYISASSDGTIEISGSGASAILNVEGAITASAISSSGTITGNSLVGTLGTAAQTNITSVGTLNVGGISSGFGNIDNGTSTLNTGNATVDNFTNNSTVAASSITGSVTGSFTGNGAGLHTVTAAKVTITDNENTDEDNAIVFTAGGDVDGGNIALESDGDLTYNPSTGTLTTTVVNATTNKFTKTGNTDAEGQGDVVYLGGTTSMDAGKLYHYKSDGTWELANSDAVATSDGLLAVALGAASDTNGMLLRGMVTLDHDPGAVGDVLYISGSGGIVNSTKPAESGDCVRVVGYCLDASNGQIWFNPSSTFVEVA